MNSALNGPLLQHYIMKRLLKILNALKLQRYELQYRWNGLDVSLVIQKIGKFEKNNPGTTINVLFNNKKGMYKAQKSEFTGKSSKQANLLMIVDGENRHYRAIKNLPRLLKIRPKKEHITFAWPVWVVLHRLSKRQALCIL